MTIACSSPTRVHLPDEKLICLLNSVFIKYITSLHRNLFFPERNIKTAHPPLTLKKKKSHQSCTSPTPSFQTPRPLQPSMTPRQTYGISESQFNTRTTSHVLQLPLRHPHQQPSPITRPSPNHHIHPWSPHRHKIRQQKLQPSRPFPH